MAKKATTKPTASAASLQLDGDQDTGLPGVELVKPAHVRTRAVLTADNHLRMTHDGSTVRGNDFFLAARSVVDIADRFNADLVLNAGDFLNVPECYSLIVQQMQDIDSRLRDVHLPMFVVQGNHDYTEPSWVDVVGGTPDTDGLHVGDGLLPGFPEIMALPFLTPADLRARLKSMVHTEHECRAQVLVWHGPVLEFAKFPSEDIITIQDLMVHPWRAVLLGDIHQCKFVRVPMPDGNYTIIGYPGATELCKRDEPLEHTCTVIDFDDRMQVVAMSHVPVDHRKVLPLRINTLEDLGKASQLVKEHTAMFPRSMVLARYDDSLSDVRHTLQLAAGKTDTIVRADSFSVETPVTAVTSSSEGGLPSPIDYLDRLNLGMSTSLRSLCVQLANPDAPSSASEQLSVYCANQNPAT